MVVKDSIILDKDAVEKAVDAMLQVRNKTNKAALLSDMDKVYVSFNVQKIPKQQEPQYIPFVLPHSLASKESDVCLIVKDLDPLDREYDATIEYFKGRLEDEGVTEINQVVPLKAIKLENQPFEMRRRFAQMYDIFLADDRIVRFLPRLLGKDFMRQKTYAQVDLTRKDLKTVIKRGLCKSRCVFKATGSSCTSVVGNVKMQQRAITENVITAVEAIASRLPGGPRNIRTVQLRAGNCMSIPLYYTDKSANTVEIQKTKSKEPQFEMKAEEITTMKNAVVKFTGPMTYKVIPKVMDSAGESSEEEVEQVQKPKRKKRNRKRKRAQKMSEGEVKGDGSGEGKNVVSSTSRDEVEKEAGGKVRKISDAEGVLMVKQNNATKKVGKVDSGSEDIGKRKSNDESGVSKKKRKSEGVDINVNASVEEPKFTPIKEKLEKTTVDTPVAEETASLGKSGKKNRKRKSTGVNDSTNELPMTKDPTDVVVKKVKEETPKVKPEKVQELLDTPNNKISDNKDNIVSKVKTPKIKNKGEKTKGTPVAITQKLSKTRTPKMTPKRNQEEKSAANVGDAVELKTDPSTDKTAMEGKAPKISKTQTPKVATPKATKPKASLTKVTSPTSATPKSLLPKVIVLEAATPEAAVSEASTPKSEVAKVASPKITTPKPSKPTATTPKEVTPKVSTPKDRAAKEVTPKITTPKSATLTKSGTPKSNTPKSDNEKISTPKILSPKACPPKSETPKAATPKVLTAKAATPKQATPKQATTKPATPKQATPKPATPKQATPKQATPKSDIPKVATPKVATPLLPRQLHTDPDIMSETTPKTHSKTPEVATPVKIPHINADITPKASVERKIRTTPKAGKPKSAVSTPTVATQSESPKISLAATLKDDAEKTRSGTPQTKGPKGTPVSLPEIPEDGCNITTEITDPSGRKPKAKTPEYGKKKPRRSTRILRADLTESPAESPVRKTPLRRLSVAKAKPSPQVTDDSSPKTKKTPPVARRTRLSISRV